MYNGVYAGYASLGCNSGVYAGYASLGVCNSGVHAGYASLGVRGVHMPGYVSLGERRGIMSVMFSLLHGCES